MAEEYFFQEGCFITEWSNSPIDPACSIARARVEPGKTTRWHRLQGLVERYVILEGTGVGEVEGQSPHTLANGDVLLIPEGKKQRITNTSTNDLIFLAICTPRFEASRYEDCESV